MDRADLPKLAVLTPTFAASSACTVVLASLSKALFLSQNPISLLPWMFLGSSILTAICALAYVGTMRRFGLEARFAALLLSGVLSLLGMRFAFPARPSFVGVLILLWCPALGQLVLVQVWSIASAILPTRQGKRLFPLLAAVATLGAAVGGVVVQLSLNWLAAEDLLVVSAVLLVWPLFDVRRIIKKLGAPESDRSTSAESESEGSPVGDALRAISKQRLLSELAIFVFLMQAASLIIDYQFSAELKPQFDKDGIASFLGTFYWVSNVAVLAITLLLTSRLIRLLGLGVALGAGGIVLGLGSGVYAVAALTGALPAFWVIAATAFMERIAQFALTRPAMQMVYIPLAGRGGERAKTMIEGVVYRLATALVSVVLLLVTPVLATQFRLSPPVVIACAVALYLALRIGPHYRRAIFEALRAHRLDASLARYLRDGLDRGAALEIQKRVRSQDARQVLAALDSARELALELPDELLEELVLHEDERIAGAALNTMDALGRKASRELLGRLLAPHRPARVLRAVLGLLSERPEEDISEILRPLTTHPDPSVASAAAVWRIRAGGAESALDKEVATGERAEQKSAFRVTGTTRAGDFARELPAMLENPNSRVRHDAVEQMGQLALPFFIEPLILCLTKGDVRDKAVAALVRHGARVLPHAREHFDNGSLPLTAKVALVHVLERLGSDEGVQALVEVCRGGEHVLRDHAVEALWRLGDDDANARPNRRALRTLVQDEIRRLETYAGVEVMLLGRPTPKLMLFQEELTFAVQRSERRAFRLLGLLYEREALQRAYLNYRHSELRTRSNAIELLEQHVTEPSLKKFVSLVERAEDTTGRMRPRSVIVQALRRSHDVEQLIEGAEPWLERLWPWVRRNDREEDLDRLLTIKQIPMFGSIPGDQLLPLVQTVKTIALSEGQCVIEQGAQSQDVYWIESGEVEVYCNDVVVARLGKHECFGEMAALDGGKRSATVRGRRSGSLLQLSHLDFLDALDLNPPLYRELIGLVSKRLRYTIARDPRPRE